MVVSLQDVDKLLTALTSKTQSAQGPANQITIVNIALAVSGFGPIPVVIARLSDIVSDCQTFISQMAGTKPFTEKSDQDAIVKSLTTHTQVGQAFLNILIGKAGLVPNLLPFVGPPLAQVLRQYESVIDTIAYELIDLVPDNANDATKQKDSYDVTMAQAIDAWNGGITIPQ